MEMLLKNVLIFSVLSLSSSVSGSLYDKVMEDMMSKIDELQDKLPVPVNSMMSTLGRYMLPLYSSSELCRNHSQLVLESFLKFELWALRIMDASSKPPAGLLDGNLINLGSYDQCLEVEAPGGIFRGQHCLVQLNISVINSFDYQIAPVRTQGTSPVFSLCIPSSCTFVDLQDHLNTALFSSNLTVVLDKTFCDTADHDPWDWIDWTGYLVVLLLVLLVISSTIYDCRRDKEECKKDILSVFSLRANVPHMLSTSRSSVAIGCLDGLRVIAIFWVIAGHRFIILLLSPNLRPKYIFDNADLYTLAPIKSSRLSVEVFFLLSGLLVVYSYLRYRHKGINFNLFYFYLHRLLRLVPAMSAVIVLYASLLVHLNDGPIWKIVSYSDRDSCRNNWWSTILLMNNYVDSEGGIELMRTRCVGQTWYLCVDFQLYLLSPLVLIPLYHKPILGLMLAASLYMATTLAALWTVYTNEIKVYSPDRSRLVYTMTHLRAASFLLGVVLGYFIFKIKQGYMAIKISKPALRAGWVLSTTLLISTLYTCNLFPFENYKYKPWLETSYIVFNDQVFSLCISWVILACTLGYGGWVDHFLSWRGWIPLARLTYSAFLSHVMIIQLSHFGMRSPKSYFWRDLWYHSLADIFSSFLAAALLYLTVEAPCCNVVDWLLIGTKKKELEVKDVSAGGALPKGSRQNNVYP